MGLADKFSIAINNFISSINEKNIYEWIRNGENLSDGELNPIVKMAQAEYNLYLAEMSPQEKYHWEIYHQKGREMACEALNNYRNSELKKTFEYFSLNNSSEINHEIFIKDRQHHAHIFNKIREYFHNQSYDRERVLAIGRMEMETNILNKYWKNAREYVVAENQKMKDILKMDSEALIRLNKCEFNNINFNSADIIRFRELNEKYFNDPLVNSYVERIEEIVSETEQLKRQIDYNWQEERDRRELSGEIDSGRFETSEFTDLINHNHTLEGKKQGKIKEYER